MLSTKRQKLNLLSEMILFAKSNEKLEQPEHTFLLGIAKQLHISAKDFNNLINHPITYNCIKCYSERIIQFYKLVRLMQTENITTRSENFKIYNYGLRMGLNHNAISNVLFLMDRFKDLMIPDDVLLDAFKVQYN